MRNLMIVAILFIVTACSKTETKTPLGCSALPMPESRPAPISASVVSPTSVQVNWRKQGRQWYQVYRNGSQVYTCQCGSFTDTGLLPNTTYTYTVNGNSVTVTTPGMGMTGNNVILLDFDGFTVSQTSWNYNGDIIAAPSGLNQTQIDSVVRMTQWGYRDFNVLITADENLFNSTVSSRRSRVVFTTTYDWFGTGAGGTAFLNSHGTENGVCFVFSGLLGFRYWDCAFVAVHETGHMFGLYHTVDFCGQGYSTSTYNWMGANFQAPFYGRSFGSVMNSMCNETNQPLIINQALQ